MGKTDVFEKNVVGFVFMLIFLFFSYETDWLLKVIKDGSDGRWIMLIMNYWWIMLLVGKISHWCKGKCRPGSV